MANCVPTIAAMLGLRVATSTDPVGSYDALTQMRLLDGRPAVLDASTDRAKTISKTDGGAED